jgi:type I restriction enzyme S subunit
MSDGWRRVPAASVARIEIGGTPAREQPTFWADQDSGHAWASIADLNSEVVVETAEYISDLGVKSSNVKLVPTGTPIMSFKLTIGRTSLAGRDLYTNEAIAAFFADRTQVDPRFLFHTLPGAARSVITDVAIKGATLNKKSLSCMQLSLPPIGEQRRIREILDALDDQIRLTDKAVSKLRATFVGLVYRLLTRGVQSDPASLGDAVLEFGATSINLPKHWTIEPIGHLLGPLDPAMRSGPFGSALLKHELVESGVPLLGIDNVHVDQFVSDFRRFVTPAKAVELSRYRVRPADVMITIMGTVGRSCLVPEDIGHALSSKHVWTLTFDDARYRPYLASLQLNHAPWARAHLRRDEQGGIMNAIRSDTLRTLMLPTPPIDEQLEIEAILKTLESKIANQEQSLTKLHTLKAGLAEDLLTGCVRVPSEVTS